MRDKNAIAPAGELTAAEPAERTADAMGSVDEAAGAASRPALHRLVTACFWLTIALCLALMVSKTLPRFEVRTLWDDAYMFQRYAYNVITDHAIAWNPKGLPTYGLTSLSFLVVVVPLYLLTGGNVSLAAMLQSFVCGIALLALLAVLARRATEDGRAERRAGILIALFCLARSAFTDHFVSGMDTTFGLGFITVYLLAALRLMRSPSTKGAVLLGVLGGLAFSVRPELTLYAVVVPLAFAALQPDRALRRAGLVAFGVTALVLGCHFTLARLYFGTPLPLPFYAKSTNLYGSGILWAYRGGSTIDLFSWLEFYWPLLAVVLVDVVTGLGEPALAAQGGVLAGPRAWWRTSSALEKSVLATTLALIGYSWVFVVPIMGFSQRFYYAPVPGLVYLACRSTSRLVRALAGAMGQPVRRVAAVAGMAFLCFQLFSPFVTAGKEMTGAIARRALGRFNIVQHASAAGPLKYWFALDKYSELPDDLLIASTEVGMLAALNLKKTVIDMAGLNDRAYALAPFSAERFFADRKPDLIYMPHPHYLQMIEALKNSPEMAGYASYTAAQLGTAEFGIAIRRDSPYFTQMQAIATKKAGKGISRQK